MGWSCNYVPYLLRLRAYICFIGVPWEFPPFDWSFLPPERSFSGLSKPVKCSSTTGELHHVRVNQHQLQKLLSLLHKRTVRGGRPIIPLLLCSNPTMSCELKHQCSGVMILVDPFVKASGKRCTLLSDDLCSSMLRYPYIQRCACSTGILCVGSIDRSVTSEVGVSVV